MVYLLVDQGFGLNPLVLRTFALAHLALLDGIDDFSKEKPIGALILSMQAVGCYWIIRRLVLTDNDRWAVLSSTGKMGKIQAQSCPLSQQTTLMISGLLQQKQPGRAARARRSIYVMWQSLFKHSRISKNPNGIWLSTMPVHSWTQRRGPVIGHQVQQ